MSLITRRKHIRPYEYPDFVEFQEAIQQSYWLVTEYNFTQDTSDFHSDKVSEAERNAIKNSMLGISNIEVAVKLFWSKVYDWFPKPEVAAVGLTFGESECRHSDAYAHLLEVLGLYEEFERLEEIPAINDRLEFLDKYLSVPTTKNPEDYEQYMKALVLFTLFVENVSLFSQFYIIKSFQKHRNLFKGMSNVIDATALEETIHALFGHRVIEVAKEEFPEWFEGDFYSELEDACLNAYKAEQKILDWIYEKGDIETAPRAVVDAYIRHRFNNDLEKLGASRVFDEDEELVKQTLWLDEELLSTKQTDFFHKRPATYSLRNKSITASDLF